MDLSNVTTLSGPTGTAGIPTLAIEALSGGHVDLRARKRRQTGGLGIPLIPAKIRKIPRIQKKIPKNPKPKPQWP